MRQIIEVPNLTEVQKVLDGLLAPRTRTVVLEAGCGSRSFMDLGAATRLVGIDISSKELARNTTLDERILGDIQSYKLPANAFDLVICWDVLEHLKHPFRAMDNLFQSVAPNGIVILAFPNLLSIKGLVTKFSPFSVHVWYYRTIMGYAEAGTDDHPPFHTYLRFSLNHINVRRFARKKGMTLELMAVFESPMQKKLRERHWLADACFRVAGGLSKTLTANHFNLNHTDCVFIFRKASS